MKGMGRREARTRGDGHSTSTRDNTYDATEEIFFVERANKPSPSSLPEHGTGRIVVGARGEQRWNQSRTRDRGRRDGRVKEERPFPGAPFWAFGTAAPLWLQ